ncbi:probable G-protein coupled receptor 25 [Ornithorhynchus anatinus]|uniref:probable G-protein coupled receptor 25 n=1 Tax=Ornithorhynchus anatinus TaxID=9258 RepID=UPI0010A90910|nr:probable G-protein coupled receptor 25 [Ornithorhynchus anatinus]
MNFAAKNSYDLTEEVPELHPKALFNCPFLLEVASIKCTVSSPLLSLPPARRPSAHPPRGLLHLPLPREPVATAVAAARAVVTAAAAASAGSGASTTSAPGPAAAALSMTSQTWGPSSPGGLGPYSGWGDYEEVGGTVMPWCPTPELPYGYAYIPALYLAAFVVGLVGNGFVVALMVGQPGPRRLVDTFVLHLAVADLVFVCTLPLWAAAAGLGNHWPFGEGLCKLSSFAMAVNRCSSALLLAGMSLDRYLVVVKMLEVRPLRTPGCVVSACGVIWAISLLAGIPSLVFRKLQPAARASGSLCGEEASDAFQSLSLALLVFTFALPLAVILFCYCLISRRLRQHHGLGRHRKNSLRIIFAVVGTFVGSWLPLSLLRAFYHLSRLGVLELPCPLLLALRWGLTLSACLAFINSCANPIIYLSLDRSFRVRALRGACGKASRLVRRASSVSSSRDSRDSGSLFQARGRTRAGSAPGGPG